MLTLGKSVIIGGTVFLTVLGCDKSAESLQQVGKANALQSDFYNEYLFDREKGELWNNSEGVYTDSLAVQINWQQQRCQLWRQYDMPPFDVDVLISDFEILSNNNLHVNDWGAATAGFIIEREEKSDGEEVLKLTIAGVNHVLTKQHADLACNPFVLTYKN